MASIKIDWKNFIRGEGQSDFAQTAGFSPLSYGLNLTKEIGKLYFREASTTISTAPTDKIIASANDANYLGNDKYFLDGSGSFYTLDGTTLTKRQTDPAGDDWIAGMSDLISFNKQIYATSTSGLWTLTGSNFTHLDEMATGLSFTATVAHPMERIEDEVFIGNANLIYYFNNSGTTANAFTLPLATNVTSLRRHPDGKTLLAFVGTTGDLNVGHTRSGEGYVYYCDTLLRKFTREVKIEAQVEGTRLVGGVIYCTWGNNFGYFDGDGLRVLRSLETSVVTHSHAMSNMEDIFLIRDGLDVLAFGDLGVGRVWWKPYRNETNSYPIDTLTYQGDNKLLVCFDSASDGVLEQVDYDNSGYFGALYSNHYYFDDEVAIKRIDVFHDTNANSTSFKESYVDLAGTENLIKDFDYTNSGTIGEKTRIQTDVRTDVFQLKHTPDNDDIGISMINIDYEPI